MKLEGLTLEENQEIEEDQVSGEDENIYLPDLFECIHASASNKDIHFVYLPESLHFNDLLYTNIYTYTHI